MKPTASSEIRETTEAEKYCRRSAGHYENFTVVPFLFPRNLRQDLFNIYAFCRLSDDLADENQVKTREDRLNIKKKLQEWDEALLQCYQGTPQHPILFALQKTINRFQLPPEPFRDLISAFIQDQEVLQYQSFEELLEYCRRSANPVGRIYLMLFNIKDDVAFALSDKICTALQLTNFWQDLCSDLFRGRIYLPLEDLKSQGYSLDDLFNKAYNQNFRQLMKFEVDRTRELFREGSELEKLLPNKIKFYIRLFRRGGEEILEKIKKIDFNVFLHRPTLSRWDKFRIFTSSLLAQV